MEEALDLASDSILNNNKKKKMLAHHDVGGVQLDTRDEVGHDASDTKVHSFYFLNL